MAEEVLNMKAQLKKVALTAGFLFVFGSAASAQSRTWNVCGGNIFNTCASVILNVISSTVLEVRVQNLSGTNGTFANTVLTAIGFDNLAVTALTPLGNGGNTYGLTTMSGPSVAGGTPSAWEVRNNKAVGGGLTLDFVGTTANGIASGIASDCANSGASPALPGQPLWASYTGCGGSGYTIANQANNGGWVVFSFSTQAHALTQADIDAAVLLVKGQNGVNGQSTELICPSGGCTHHHDDPGYSGTRLSRPDRNGTRWPGSNQTAS
jgi:hypothetical protein